MSEYPVGATHTTGRIVSALEGGREAGVTELAGELGISKASVHNHLVTLERLGVVVSTDGRYRLGLRFLDIGMSVRDGMPLYAVAREETKGIAESTGESSALVIEEHGEAVYADVERPERNGGRIRLGSRHPLHASAAGKLILAYRSRETVDEYVETRGLDRFTDRTIQSRADLRDELRSIRDRGLSFDRGEYSEDMRAVAAPIRREDRSEALAGALSVLGPAERLSGKRLEEDLPGIILSAAKRVELDLSE
ncbi:IclR family transcriptional regulator [Halobellus rufus]|uniref:IclR family transcriptional regulator n=1 Tax=Halobellus rufus TaxID=1448860 RepID=UPI000679D487|nr:IclR family transcriptional regulator [Halobellus rufus]